MRELEIHVEQAVRPVRASRDRKLKMREELLAHLQGIYDEELELRGDEESAREAALQRFGPSAEISRNLQSSVPLASLGVWWFFRGCGDGSVHQVTLWAWRQALLSVLVCVIPWHAVRVFTGDLQAGEAAWLVLLLTIYGLAMLGTAIQFVAYALGMLGKQRSLLRGLLWGAMTWCAFMSLPALFWSTRWVGPNVGERLWQNDRTLLLIAALNLILVILIALLGKSKRFTNHLRDSQQRDEQEDRWLQLELSSEMG